ncbi:hypothetical protein LJC46_01780 [Desulfovibrio sp. OttesenSCG-928-G15]|nr:hypothetical protein [Desulfovibrio sp. OttesenSCG-928-G15]
MSDTPYLGETTDLILGQEFLTWLWFRSATGSIFNDKKGTPFSVSMEQRIVVQGGEGDHVETASVSGLDSELREARLGLTTGKKVTRALLRLERGPEEWQLTLKASDFTLNSLKTPKIDRSDRDDADPDALLLEKIALVEGCLELVDVVYGSFLNIRLDEKGWKEEVQNLRKWMAA